MSDTLAAVRGIIRDVCSIPDDKIRPGIHLLDDLGIDSVDFLDVAHEIDRKFKITLPIEEWADEINRGAPSDRYFVLDRVVEQIEKLVLAQA